MLFPNVAVAAGGSPGLGFMQLKEGWTRVIWKSRGVTPEGGGRGAGSQESYDPSFSFKLGCQDSNLEPSDPESDVLPIAPQPNISGRGRAYPPGQLAPCETPFASTAKSYTDLQELSNRSRPSLD
jgi:hypothetical protein